MLSQKEIENLINIDYDDFLKVLIKEMSEISQEKNIISDILSVSDDTLRSKIIEELRSISLNKILNEK